MYAMRKEMREKGVPSNWLNYVSVTEADKTAKAIEQNGGKLVMPPFDVMDMGRMAVASDPAGAAFAIWQPKGQVGAQVTNEPGAMCWNELAARDVEGAKRFYKAILGWGGKTDKSATPYTEFTIGEKSIGGMIQMSKEWGNAPPYWMPYFAVADCNQSADRAAKLKAKIRVPPTDVPKVGRFSVIQDPTAAVFGIISFPS
jgi:predicted enzyme related to lactoylglutathione lyase